jgi:hypothetical protein
VDGFDYEVLGSKNREDAVFEEAVNVSRVPTDAEMSYTTSAVPEKGPTWLKRTGDLPGRCWGSPSPRQIPFPLPSPSPFPPP